MITLIIKDRAGKELLVQRVNNLNELMDAMLLDDDNVSAALLEASISAACAPGGLVIITVDADFVGRHE